MFGTADDGTVKTSVEKSTIVTFKNKFPGTEVVAPPPSEDIRPPAATPAGSGGNPGTAAWHQHGHQSGQRRPRPERDGSRIDRHAAPHRQRPPAADRHRAVGSRPPALALLAGRPPPPGGADPGPAPVATRPGPVVNRSSAE